MTVCDELGRERFWLDLRCHPVICLERFDKTYKKFQDKWVTGQYSKWVLPECVPDVLRLRPFCLSDSQKKFPSVYVKRYLLSFSEDITLSRAS
jgi:hypothetical protein